ncbi:glycosyltransferase family 2 protein [Acidisoma cellulosilytica]|uniref:Glycosyltransferase family 2 protein n=1 Tax=Acidisoma cellulosilyticum TaxID=2802395 RepID=A0A963Z5N7_9PROT|nr:glycosyltransferase family 2 protein [Acidisoma cellulosilyticum]MCB8883360.1 glycosyltransferase family 2 protein [Acidisoma cellulosilyticum]
MLNADKVLRVAAIIGHADDASMLEACIAHHLSVGAANVFVSVNRGEAELDSAIAGDDRVRALPIRDFSSQDVFQYFTHAIREVERWVTPDFVLFTDSDEFWLPQSGDLRSIPSLEKADLAIVERYNAFPQRNADNSITPPHYRSPYRAPMILAREPLEDAYGAQDYRLPWIFGVDAPKIIVRPGMVQSVGPGGHNIVATDPGLRWVTPAELVILHAPFTDEARFRRKIASVRQVFASHAQRFNDRQAWHWRYWLSLSDAELGAEFRRQAIPAAALGILTRDAIVGSAEELYRELEKRAAPLRGDALDEFLERAITNYDRTLTRDNPMLVQGGGA